MEDFIGIIMATAWPATILAIALIFRAELKGLTKTDEFSATLPILGL
jgi:hypothetical protein